MNAEADKKQKTAAELFPGRVSLSISEFCAALGWNRARYYRHRSKIRVLTGFGSPMIPVAELDRIIGEPQPEEASA